jgi:hypothetical protein
VGARERSVRGAGLGLRRAFIGPLLDRAEAAADFLELAPENWIDVGGRPGRAFRAVAERFPLVAHGLSLNLGGAAPLDRSFLRRARQFLDGHRVRIYREHLSYCADDGHLYDLLPIPFTEEAVRHVAVRVRQTQDLLGRRIAVENVSYYAAPARAMLEVEFLRAVLEEADCDLLLDVNNVYVNSINHGYDPLAFLAALPGERVAYAHVAGHFRQAPDLAVDTHGAPVVDPVWRLLGEAYRRFGVFPTLLERDFNIPPLAELIAEVETIRAIQERSRSEASAARASPGESRVAVA